MIAAALHVLLLLVLLAVLAACLVAGIHALARDTWARLAEAVLWLSEVMPRAAAFIAKGLESAGLRLLFLSARDAEESEPAADESPFDPAPKPDGPDPAEARADQPSVAEVTRFDVPLVPGRDRPYLGRLPFGGRVAARMTRTAAMSEAGTP